jgi:hypothetical protein
MTPDAGFAELITRGPLDALDDDDLRILHAGRDDSA